MTGSLATGAGAPNTVVEIQPGMLVQAVTLVDQSGLPVSPGIATALATLTTPVVVSAATAPTTSQVLTATSASAATWQTPSPGFTNPMTTLGDIIYENATPAAARLSGNTTATTELLSSTGGGTVAAAPAWKSLATLGIAPLASPALSGTPTVPTAAALTSNTQAASTAYADTAVSVLRTAMQAYAAAAGQSGGMTGLGYAGATASFANAAATSAAAWTSGYLYGAWIFCVPGAAVNGYVSVFPWTTGALAGTYMAVYNSAGVQLGITADLSATGTNARGIRVALTGFTAVPADGKIFAVYTNGTSASNAGPSRMSTQIANAGAPNSGISALTVSGAEYQTPTTMPASLTYGASGIPSAPGAWNGASSVVPLMALD